jgi:hypothetical protein
VVARGQRELLGSDRGGVGRAWRDRLGHSAQGLTATRAASSGLDRVDR